MNDSNSIFLKPEVTAICCEKAEYPKIAPFHPQFAYPEYIFPNLISDESNHVYSGIRDSFHLLKLDSENFGTKNWNPLKSIIKKNDCVVVKPNYVLHVHFSDLDYDSVVTHSSILRAVIDYILLAVGNKGKVIVADAPLKDADFSEICRKTQIDSVVKFYKEQGYAVSLVDMRYLSVIQNDGFVVKRVYNTEQLNNSTVINIAEESAFHDIEHLMYRVAGADYDRRTTKFHHNNGHHEYRISRYILDADVVFSLGKLKTHKKSGVTLSMKNIVGINVDKNFLPHYRIGMPCQGGDEFPDRMGISQKLRQWFIRLAIDTFLIYCERAWVPFFRKVLKLFPKAKSDKHYANNYSSKEHPGYNQKMIERFYSFILGSNIRDGNWSGNDTTWRMVVDLNTILMYCDRKGKLHNKPVRRYFSIIDGILGGGGEGPMNHTPLRSGVILAGYNPLSVDWCATKLMGFNPERLKIITKSRKLLRPLGPDKCPIILTNNSKWAEDITIDNSLSFPPHSFWKDIQEKS